MKNFNLGGLHEKVLDLSSYLKDGEGSVGLLQSYNNFAGNLWLLVVLSALFSSIIVMKIKETRRNFQSCREIESTHEFEFEGVNDNEAYHNRY